jgi:hypothetical protein
MSTQSSSIAGLIALFSGETTFEVVFGQFLRTASKITVYEDFSERISDPIESAVFPRALKLTGAV